MLTAVKIETRKPKAIKYTPGQHHWNKINRPNCGNPKKTCKGAAEGIKPNILQL